MGDDKYVRAPQKNMQPEGQHTSAVCWYTCYRMMYSWKNWDRSKILSKLKAAGIDVEAAKKTGLKLKDNKKAAQALDIRPVGYGQPVKVHNLKQLLGYSPIWATGQWMGSGCHVVVIMGASEKFVEYFDPWWTGAPEDAYTVKKREMDWFLHGDGKTNHGLAYTAQKYPLGYFRS